ncbi:MAG TPA: 3-phosphoglycerate dehydrogenase, partial [Deltaproteobacteria bacterium]|nr:3-phosphoglycerate dehydrogenase [Deltaproteobacteria bacterium]
NIPVDKCSERGIVVFNTPGANANAVKELVLLGLLLCSRKVIDGIIWAKSLIGKGAEVPKLIEKGKSQFAGNEIKGKKLGIIGLGAIGVMVANDACALGMEVTGFDPFISVDSAWGLSRNVKRANGLESLITESDYISIHVPLTDQTKGMINRDKFALMKKGVHLLNFSRGGLVNNEDLKDAIEKNIVATYVTDFPDEEVLKMKNVIGIPHLGASTKEAEENCAIMAVNQLREFLEKGNIKNSVNLPDCEMPFSTSTRLLIINRNIPKMVGQITGVLAEKKINIANMLNKHKGDYAYNIIDIDGEITEQDVEKIRDIEGVIMVRVLLKE